MRKLTILILTLLLVILVGVAAAWEGPSEDRFTVELELIAENITQPVTLTEPPDDSGRLFVVDQIGLIWMITPDGTRLDEPFLDIRDKIVDLNPDYDERGLLGLAFHPDYAANGRFFVYYSAPLRESAPDDWNHTNVLAEYTVSADDPNRADPTSEAILLREDWPYSNHNGGTLAFGPQDGMLYLSWGDGGNRDDEGMGHVEDWYEANAGGNGQDIEQNPKGSLMRLDVSTPGTYAVPADNPFVGQLASDVLELQWAYGFRNPYRFSFDMFGNHDLFVGDAGQNLWEEVDIVFGGENYGWNVKEGTHCFDAEDPRNPPPTCPDGIPATADHPDAGEDFEDPIIEFANAGNPLVPEEEALGLVVVGGYVYRGNELPQFFGDYLFAVWSQGEVETDEGEMHFPGRIFVARPRTGEDLWAFRELEFASMPDGEFQHFVLGFGQDREGEVYVLATDEVGPTGNTGKVYRLAPHGRVDDRRPHDFRARLTGAEEMPPVDTDATGTAEFEVNDTETAIHFDLQVRNLEDVVAAPIHCGLPGVNGPVGVTLFRGGPVSSDGVLVQGTLTEPDPDNACGWHNVEDVYSAMLGGNTYVNVHTQEHPAGEIRGPIVPMGSDH